MLLETIINMRNRKTKKSLRYQKGFTFIELMISMAIIAILSASVIQMARFSDTHKSLTLAVDEFRASLRTAQSSALSIPNPQDRHVCGFGVWIGDSNPAFPGIDNKYEVFYTFVDFGDFADDPETCKTDPNYRNGTGTVNYERISGNTLPSGLNFQGHIDETIFFIVPYGETYGNDGALLGADMTFTIANISGDTKSAIVTPEGKID